MLHPPAVWADPPPPVSWWRVWFGTNISVGMRMLTALWRYVLMNDGIVAQLISRLAPSAVWLGAVTGVSIAPIPPSCSPTGLKDSSHPTL